jgi:uncharacterized membrane protein YqgA involved in biofilm formation
VVLLLGVKMGLETKNILIQLVSISLGVAIGHFLGFAERLDKLGAKLEKRFSGGKAGFGSAFAIASIATCVGPLAIMGSVADGISGDLSLLVFKSVLDGIACVPMAAALGIGVAFSSLSILVYQGGITLLAGLVKNFLSTAMISEMTSAGGIIMVGMSLNMLEVKDLKDINALPALILAPLAVAILTYFGISV